MDQLSVQQKWEDMAEYILKCVVVQLPKSERYATGTIMRTKVVEIGVHIARAVMFSSVSYKRGEIAKADLALGELKILLRLARRLAYIDSKKSEVSARYTTELGRMIGGWNKSLSTQGR